jgi:CRP-like cAMP-binding protein
MNDDDQAVYGDLLSVADRAALLAAGTVRRFAAGDMLFRAGDWAQHVMFIEQGRVKVVSAGRDGREALLAIRGPGELIGEFAVMDGKPRSAGVQALEPVRARAIPATRFKAFLKERPDASSALVNTILGRLREADRRRLELAVYDVATRVAMFLLELAGQPTSGRGRGSSTHSAPATKPIVVVMSQRELADATGSSREAVVKVLRRLRSTGMITTSRRAITIMRPDLLAEISESVDGSEYLDADADRESP